LLGTNPLLAIGAPGVAQPGFPLAGDTDKDGLGLIYEQFGRTFNISGPTAAQENVDTDNLVRGVDPIGFGGCLPAFEDIGPCDSDVDNDGITDRIEGSIWGSSAMNPDSDGDGIGDKMESMKGCGLAAYGLSKGDGVEGRVGFADNTHPDDSFAAAANGMLDCDADQDNDGLPDAAETLGGGANACLLAGGPNVLTLPGGNANISIDDDHDGLPAPGDAGDDLVPFDHDGDGQLDGYECANGFDPTSTASKDGGPFGGGICGDTAPAIVAGEWSGIKDDDADGLLDGWELCKWGTDPLDSDTDGDGVGDCREAADIDGGGIQNISDAIIVAKSALLTPTSRFGRDWVLDFDGSGVVNITDAVLVAQLSLVSPASFCNPA
jgi:hypothetical protein